MLNLFPKSILLCALLGLLCGTVTIAEAAPAGDFQRDIKPILAKYCYRCHNEKKKSGDVGLHNLDSDLTVGKDAETWHDVLNQLNLGEMPPEKATQPTEAEREKLVDWLTAEMKRAAAIKRRSGGRVVLRRLTRYEYANTMRDLLGVDLNFAEDLPPDSTSREGFQNNGTVLGMSPLQIEYYLKTARLGLSKAIVTGDRPEVFKHHAEKSVKAGGRRSKAITGNRMPPGGVFMAKMLKFPREGEFVIRVKVSARIPEGAAYPRMSAAIGVKADVLAPKGTVGEIEVTAPLGSPQVYEFRGRIEDYPLPGKSPKFPGVVISLTHESKTPVAGKGGKKNKGKRNRNKTPQKEDPNQPLIVVESVDFEGPVFDAWPPSSHTRILFPRKSENETVYAREVLSRFLPRAYRRPVDKSEVDGMMALYAKVRPRVASFEVAMREVLAMALISPDFLYLLEPRDEAADVAKKQPLTNHELAARLSYLLWSTMPDERLTQLANNGTLRESSVLEKQVRVMLADKRSWNFVENFSSQWLGLDGLDRVAVNPEYYPKFDDQLKRDMRLEPQHFFAEILQNDLSALNLLDSRFAMLNRPLAKHYGISGPRGLSFERVALKPEHHRGGLLTQAAVLLSNSTGEDSHPIRRAVWLLDRLLDDPPPPPPPDVPDLKSDQPGFAGLPLKKQLELHRTKTACSSCHRKIDPWGVPFENYDAVGRWRTKVVKPVRVEVAGTGAKNNRKRRNQKKRFRTAESPVDATSVLPGGHNIAGVDELKRHLLAHERDRFSRAIVKKLLAYALGRSPEPADDETINRLAKQFAKSDYRLSNLIVAIVQSEEFRSK